MSSSTPAAEAISSMLKSASPPSPAAGVGCAGVGWAGGGGNGGGGAGGAQRRIAAAVAAAAAAVVAARVL